MGPSAPRPPRCSNNEKASDRDALQAKIDLHLRNQARLALARMAGGACLTFALASCFRKDWHSPDHRPPTSQPAPLPANRGAQQGNTSTPISRHLAGSLAPLRVAKSPVTFLVATLRWPPVRGAAGLDFRGAQYLGKAATHMLDTWSTVGSAIAGA